MGSVVQGLKSTEYPPGRELAMAQVRWYATYTCANHEKQVAAQVQLRALECFLPLYRSVRRWKDRRVTLDSPLFPGYLFVRLALRDRLRVLQIPSVVHLVSFSGQPVSIPDDEMDRLRRGLSHSLCAEPHPFLTAGRRVSIIRGPLAGYEGILLRRRKNNFRFVISIDLIRSACAVDVDAADVQPI
jgi:transcription antitermination factor NusG